MRVQIRPGNGRTAWQASLRLLVVAFVLTAGVLSAGAASAKSSGEPAVQAPASVLATCSGTGCNYKDPQATGCATGAGNFDDWIYAGYRVEYRYSPTCRAVWARATYVSGNAASFGAYLESKVGSGSVVQWVSWRGNSGWSLMYTSGVPSRIVAVANTGTHYGPWI
jgi:hypothetical protein